MRRLGFVAASAALVVLLVAVEIIIIKGNSGYKPGVEVVFARAGIPEKTVITADMLELKEVDADLLHPQSVRNMADITGKTSRMDIEKGEMILSGKLGIEDTSAVKLTDSRNRLFTVEFKTDQANGWQLESDGKVDIIFIPDRKREDRKVEQSGTSGGLAAEEAESVTSEGAVYPAGPVVPEDTGVQVLKAIRIAAVIDEKGKLLDEGDGGTLPRYISFEVTPAQAEFLAYAKGSGRLELSAIQE